MARTNLTGAVRDKILFDVTVLGVPAEEEAVALGIVPQSVYNTILTFERVKARDWDAIKESYTTSKRGINCLEWAIARANATPPPGFVDELAALQRWVRHPVRAETAKETPAKETPTLPDPTPNDALVWVKVLEGLAGLLKGQAALIEAIQKQQDDFRDALTALASDIKENANVNSDLVCQRLKEANDALAGIKANTRKKGL